MSHIIAQPSQTTSSLELIQEFLVPESSRTSLLNTSLIDIPFQLLPHTTYRPAQLESGLEWQEKFSKTFENPPLLSICLVFQNAESSYGRELLESLAVQSYRNFEVKGIISRSSDAMEGLCRLFESLQVNGSLYRTTTNSWSPVYQEILEKLQGRFILQLEDTILLHPHALFILAKSIIHDRPDFLYANELLLTKDRKAKEFYRKAPPDKYTLLSMNSLGSPLVFSTSFAKQLVRDPLFQEITQESLDWFFATKLRASGAKVKFVPLALFVKREDAFDQQILETPSNPGRCKDEANLKSIELLASEYGKATDMKLRATLPGREGSLLTCRPCPVLATGKIQAIIPFKNKSQLTVACLEKLLIQDCVEDLEITLVDNGSTAEERECIERFLQKQLLSTNKVRGTVEIISDHGCFNFARLNNQGAACSRTPYILFLNNDVELGEPQSISELRNWCAQDDVGTVGGELSYDDGSLQHAGINFLGVRPCNVNTKEQFSFLVRETNAVTFAMAMVKRSVFEVLGGLDEFLCPNGFGDALFCHRLRKLGYRVLFTPYAKGIHHESISRGFSVEELELFEMVQEGLPICDLYADCLAEHQPTKLQFSTVAEPTAAILFQKMIRSRKISKVINGFVELVLGSTRAGSRRKLTS